VVSYKSTMARVRLYEQLTELQTSHLANVQFCNTAAQLQCTLHIKGAQDSPYELGTYMLRLKFQEDYPYTPPEVHFLTPIKHCNVSQQGFFCHKSLCCDWRFDKSVLELVGDIEEAMRHPDLQRVCWGQEELARLFVREKARYRQEVMSMTVEWALWDAN